MAVHVATLPNGGGGYEYQFVDTPSDMFVCKICQYPSKEPHLSGCCGHTFCKSCLEDAKRVTTITKACPICQDKEFVTFCNRQADQAIRSLHVFCNNKEKGCEWQGEVNDIINHLGNSDGCQFEDVTCSNDCGKCLQRQYLTGHVEDECIRREVDCQYCHITGEHQFIEGEHKEQCPKFPIACPNKCEVGSVPRDDVKEHMKMCPLELIQCEYHVVGCEERMARKDQKKHNKEKMEEHLSFTTRQLINTQHNLANSQVEAVDSKDKLSTQTGTDLATSKPQLTSAQLDAVKTIDKLIQRLADTKADLKSIQEEARKTKNDLTQQLVVTNQKLANTQTDLNTTKQQLATTCQNLTKAEKEHITLAANTDEILAKLETKFQTKITEIETAAQKRITELETKLEQKSKLLEDVLFSDKDLWWKMINSSSSKQKTQQIEQSVSDPNIFWYNTVNYQASKLSSGDQVTSVIVKMSEYAKKKSDRVSLYSDSFYTHHKGYKMCLYVYATGYDGYMKVFLILMEGPYDDELRWPLKGNCEVKLLNQISNSEHHLGNGQYRDNGHKRVTSAERNSYPMWYTNQFIPREHLQKITPTCQYLKDDSIFLQVDYKLGTV
ncbi:TNF receptor-associated factor 3-like [Dysidea avara]|uniref:TNF receptor-associated factor 3-like n=1 Tax=Dysidea avara TaxID=196820 RepID=UPI00332D5106